MDLCRMLGRPWGPVVLALAGAWAPAFAQVLVTPAEAVLLAGETQAFRARLVYGGVALAEEPVPGGDPGEGDPAGEPGRPCWRHRGEAAQGWLWTILDPGLGTLDEHSGVFTAPEVQDPALVRIRATWRADPGMAAEALILVLPQEPFAVVAKVQGPDWLVPFSHRMPFQDLGTGGRFQGWGPVVEWPGGQRPSEPCLGGYGLPCTLRWVPRPWAQGQLLSYREGGEVVRRDVTGQSAQVVTARGRITDGRVEALKAVSIPGGEGAWRAHVQKLPHRVQGVVPLAGNPQAAPGHQDGQGLGARFREPSDLAAARDPEGWKWVVTDAGSHVVRLVTPGGHVTTLCGVPGQAGHRDRIQPKGTWWDLGRSLLGCPARKPALGPALFNQPSFLRIVPFTLGHGRRSWRAVVADSGNHALRVIGPDGTVDTVAGIPGQAGHRDAALPLEALFHTPMGLAVDPAGNCYVADQGNRVIRKVSPLGRVTTLAGRPNEPGTEDGLGTQARFTELRGLALSPHGPVPDRLLVVDGHALRTISLPEGQVQTVLGVVDRPGFRDVAGGDRDARRLALGQPCLRAPRGLLWGPEVIHIADQGNHAIRAWRPEEAVLETLAGDPGQGETRWGLLRGGVSGPLDGAFAALRGPGAVAEGRAPDGGRYLCVPSGASLVEVSLDADSADRLLPVRLEAPAEVRAEPCRVRFSVAALSAEGEPVVRTVHYTVDFLDPDGTLAERRAGVGASGASIQAEGSFSRPGEGRVVVRCVTDQGVAADAQWQVKVW